MSADTNVSETLVGIATFVDPSIPGFSAIIKQRYRVCPSRLLKQTNQKKKKKFGIVYSKKVLLLVTCRYSDFIVNEVDQDNQTVRLTSFELPELDPEALKARDDKIQAKDDLEQANSEMDEAAKLTELAAVLDNDEETMAQVKKMLDSYGNDLEFVNLKVTETSLFFFSS